VQRLRQVREGEQCPERRVQVQRGGCVWIGEVMRYNGFYIPLDKSWMIRMGVLDLVGGYDGCVGFLVRHLDDLSDDLQAMCLASLQWRLNLPLYVGESATIYRFLKFASWKLGQDREFVIRDTLKNRDICDDPEIVDWSLERLLTLDNGTSQWASASVLMGNEERIPNPPYKLQLTYDAVKHWKTARSNKRRWEPRYDKTILKQALAYLQWLRDGHIKFVPMQAEDYCFARAFGIITQEEGEKRWPSLRGHESNRYIEMEDALHQKEVTSKDHRVVQAVAMLKGGDATFMYPGCVNKSWPQFWRFLKDSPYIYE